jgi:dihydroorotase
MKPISGKVAYVNARLLDPATGLDAPGGLLTEGETVAALGAALTAEAAPADAEVVDCRGLCPPPDWSTCGCS